MFSKNMQAIYSRLMILGLLSMCLFVFGFSENIETAHAAVCQQDCDRYKEICDDNCQDECSDTGQRHSACNSCLTSCSVEWNSCSEHSIYCTSGTIT
mgnify:CR=1 FL=1